MDDLIRRSDVLDKVVIYPNYSENGESVDTYVVFDDDVMSIPAVDAVEVRHGEWIWDGYVYDAPWQCSECQKLNDIASNYCPHCGARMDGEDGDGDG